MNVKLSALNCVNLTQSQAKRKPTKADVISLQYVKISQNKNADRRWAGQQWLSDAVFRKKALIR